MVEHIGNMVVARVIYINKKQNFTLCPFLQGVKAHVSFEIFKGKVHEVNMFFKLQMI